MKRTACCVAAVSALMMIASGPASAQAPWNQQRDWNQPGDWNRDQDWRGAQTDPYQRIAYLQTQLDEAMRQGSIDPAAARRIGYRLDEMRRTADNQRRRHRGYLSPDMVNYIDQRLDRVSRELRWRENMAGGYDTPRDRWDR